ncbi:MAG: NrdH-redoxin [Chloroflexi bacterium]|nr:NrdH-redoxin [Chloroflexota bacterium]
MTSKNVAFTDLDVANDETARKDMSAKTQGKMVVPVVEIDGEVKIGYDEGWIMKKLDLT